MDHTDRIRGRHPAAPRAGRPARLLLALAAMAAVLLPGVPAWAHNALAEASPDKNATLTRAPSEVKLRFLQKLDPDYTTITVSAANKQPVPVSAPDVDGATGTVEFPDPLPGGVYTVAYQVVSTDGHTVKGSYEFTVAGAPAPSSAAAPAPSAVPASDSAVPASAVPAVPASAAPAVAAPVAKEDSATGTVLGLVAGIVVVLAGLAGFLYIRRRKT